MILRRKGGFTLIEIMVSVAILGILAVTAIPTYRTWHSRALGTEAKIMAKQILDAQIVYFMEHDNKFYPEGSTLEIYSDDDEDSANVLDVASNLNIIIPTGHFLNYGFAAANTPGDETFTLFISSSSGADIFRGASLVTYTLDRGGKINESYM